MVMKIEELRYYKKCKELATEYWGLEFNIPVKISGRMTQALGRYSYHINRSGNFEKPLNISLSKRLVENYNKDIIESVLKHELTHWALSMLNKPFNDGHPVFEAELKRVGAHSTGIIPFVGEMHIGLCGNCKRSVVSKKRKSSIMKLVESSWITSKCCGSRVTYGGVKKYENEEFGAKVEPKPSQPARKVQPQREVATAAITSAEVTTPIITPGPRGVTNKQMIPAIREALDLNSKERLEILKRDYPSVYEGTLRYIGKSYHTKLVEIMGN